MTLPPHDDVLVHYNANDTVLTSLDIKEHISQWHEADLSR